MEVTYHCAVTSDTNTDGGGYYRALDMFFSLDGGSDAQQAVKLCHAFPSCLAVLNPFITKFARAHN